MKIIKRLWIFGAFLYSVFFLFTCFSRFVPPSAFQYISFTSLAFPVLIIGQILLTLITFLISKRTALFCVLCLCFSWFNVQASVGFHNPGFEMKRTPETLRVLTWNVEYFLIHTETPEKRLDMLGVIKKYSPDVLCLQDYSADNDMQNELKRLGYPHRLVTDSTDAGYNGVAIFSKYSFNKIETPVADTLTGEKIAVAEINYADQPIRVYSIHLQSYSLFADTSGTHSRLGNYKIGFERKRYFAKRIRDAEKVHEKQVDFIKADILQHDLPAVVCGDLNSVPTSYTQYKLAKGMRDSHIEKGYFLGGTYFHLFPSLRIDVCIVSETFAVLQTTVDQQKLSDHKAVITDLKLNR